MESLFPFRRSGSRIFLGLVFGDRLGELIGAGSAVAAADAFEKRFDFVDILSLDETGNSL